MGSLLLNGSLLASRKPWAVLFLSLAVIACGPKPSLDDSGGSETSTSASSDASTGTSAGTSTGSGSTASTGAPQCPPELDPDWDACGKETENLMCCGLLSLSDPPCGWDQCQPLLETWSKDADLMHCVEPATLLLECVAQLPCEELGAYALAYDAYRVDDDATAFSGAPCEEEAIAATSDGCFAISCSAPPGEGITSG